MAGLSTNVKQSQSVAAATGLEPRVWLGLALLAVTWPLNWLLPGTRTAYLFFPLWLAYIMIVDGIVCKRRGSSLWSRSRSDFAFLFLISAPCWWLFEWLNSRTGNWEYLGGHKLGPLEYYVLCSISFSTVMPAVFETAELVRSFAWMDRLSSGPIIRKTPGLQAALLLGGALMVALTLAWPRYCYPFVWTAVLFFLEPVNQRLGRPYLLQDIEHGDWRPVLSLAFGALICGFFWEMWNYYSYPKWIYHTPGAQFLHIFEMPLLGYGGYLPFALELYALKSFLWPRGPTMNL
jgi:hypothetical protein